MLTNVTPNLASQFAALDNIPDFLKAFENIKHNITLSDLRSTVEEGRNKGKTFLILLAQFSLKESPDNSASAEAFDYIWKKFKNKISLSDLTVKTADDGQSVLWFLAYMQSVNRVPYFSEVLELFPEITIFDLRVNPQNHLSLLGLLASADLYNDLDPFTTVWNKFNISLDDLLKIEREGDREVPLLWILAYWNSDYFFKLVWPKFKDQITIAHLRIKCTTGDEAGKTLLWLLVRNAYPNKQFADIDIPAQRMSEIWDKFNKEITEEDLRARAEDGDDNGVSLMRCLFSAAHIPVQEQNTSPVASQLGEHISMLCSNKIEELLTQFPHVVSEAELTEDDTDFPTFPSISFVLSTHRDKTWSAKITNLIKSGNLFLKELSETKGKKTLAPSDFDLLFKLADEASSAGYLNAYYDLGLLLVEKNHQEASCRAFVEVPPEATQYFAANQLAAHILYAQSLLDHNSEDERYAHLNAALSCILRTNDKQKTDELVHKIASSYIARDKRGLQDTQYLHPAVLEYLYTQDPSTVDLTYFDHARELSSLIFVLDALLAQHYSSEPALQSKSKTTMPAPYIPHFTSTQTEQPFSQEQIHYTVAPKSATSPVVGK